MVDATVRDSNPQDRQRQEMTKDNYLSFNMNITENLYPSSQLTIQKNNTYSSHHVMDNCYDFGYFCNNFILSKHRWSEYR